MKTLHSMLLVTASLLLPAGAVAANYAIVAPTCEKMAQGPNSPEACRASVMNDERMREHRPAVYKMYKTSTGELCKSASSASKINNNRCQEAVDELKHLLDERKQKMADRCGEYAEQVKACQRCQTNLSAAGCQEENIKINDAFTKNSEAWIASHKRIVQATKNVENEMFQLSEDYGENLAELQGDMMTGKPTSPAAQEIGASSISDGLNKHGNASPAEIFRAIEEFRNQSEITSSDMQEVQNIQSKYARESLSRAVEAKAARLEMEKEISQEKNGLVNLNKNTQTVSKNTTNLGSVDPAASRSAIGGTPTADASTMTGLAGAGAGAAGGLAGGMTPSASGTSPGSFADQQVAGNTSGTFDPNSGKPSNYLLNGVANSTAGAKTAAIQDIAAAEQAAGDTTAVNSTSASRMSVRESLRAKLADQLAQGKGSATGASQAAAGKAGSLEAKLKEKAGANPDMLMGFSPAEFSAAGGGDSFSMAQSETDAAVKEMMGEFEGPADETGFGGMRHLASVGDKQSTPEILAADSSDLFHRTREFYERCQKRGCVTR